MGLKIGQTLPIYHTPQRRNARKHRTGLAKMRRLFGLTVGNAIGLEIVDTLVKMLTQSVGKRRRFGAHTQPA